MAGWCRKEAPLSRWGASLRLLEHPHEGAAASFLLSEWPREIEADHLL